MWTSVVRRYLCVMSITDLVDDVSNAATHTRSVHIGTFYSGTLHCASRLTTEWELNITAFTHQQQQQQQQRQHQCYLYLYSTSQMLVGDQSVETNALSRQLKTISEFHELP